VLKYDLGLCQANRTKERAFEIALLIAGDYRRLGDVDQAEAIYKWILAASPGSGSASSTTGDVLSQMATIYALQAKINEAIAADERALQILSKLDENASVKDVSHTLGGLYEKVGRLSDAARAYERALRILKKNGWGETDDACKLASVYARQNKLQAAEKLLKEEMAKTALMAKTSAESAFCQSVMEKAVLGSVYVRQRKYKEAESMLRPLLPHLKKGQYEWSNEKESGLQTFDAKIAKEGLAAYSSAEKQKRHLAGATVHSATTKPVHKPH
jgi:tetratricopeptide (TPR) repeat protein